MNGITGLNNSNEASGEDQEANEITGYRKKTLKRGMSHGLDGLGNENNGKSETGTGHALLVSRTQP